jgi:F-type H+-transporting ATPase subunit b
MQIDWWTFIAQIINLVILLFLLRKFLYIPVLRAVEARQKLIADELKEAANAKKQALKLTDECNKRLADIEAQKQKILAQTGIDAGKLADSLMLEAQEQYKNACQQWQNKLIGEQQSFEATVRHLITEYFTGFADKALTQMADIHLNDLIIAKFIDKLADIKQEQHLENKQKFEIQSAQPLNKKNQELLQKTLQKQFKLATNVKFEYTLNQSLICGIIVQAEDQQISWNLADYMQEFQAQMNAEMQKLFKRN